MDTPNENATQVGALDPQQMPEGLPQAGAKPIEREQGVAAQEASADDADPNVDASGQEPQAGKPNDPDPQDPQGTEAAGIHDAEALPSLRDLILALKEHLADIVTAMPLLHDAVMVNGVEMCLSRASSEISAAIGWLDQALAIEKAAN